MASGHTKKYQLSQWERSDKVVVEDFNSDNRNIENALAGLDASKAEVEALEALRSEVSGKAEQSELDSLSGLVAETLPEVPRIAVGTYTGTGTCGETGPTVVTFPFEPKLVILTGDHAEAVCRWGQQYVGAHVGMNLVNFTAEWDGPTLSWYATRYGTSNPTTPNNAAYQMNTKNVVYHYFIIG